MAAVLKNLEVKMNNKGVGAVFCLIAAILMAVKYLSAAIFMSGVQSWDRELFQCGLHHVGAPLTVLAALALAVGLFFLIWGIIQDVKAPGKK